MLRPTPLSAPFVAQATRALVPGTTRVMIACMPKSGSTLLRRALMEATHWPRLQGVLGFQRTPQNLYPSLLLNHARQNGVYQQHLQASEIHVALLNQFRFHTVVLVRNLLDVAASLFDHLHRESRFSFAAYLTDDFFELDRPTQLDLVVELLMPWFINFYVGWHDAWQSNVLNMTWVTYEELVADMPGTVGRILEFIGQPKSEEEVSLALQRAVQSHTRFNKGVTGRGLKTLSPEQVDRIRSLTRFYPWVDFSRIGLEPATRPATPPAPHFSAQTPAAESVPPVQRAPKDMDN
ncbi:MAG: sulfotransferase domain-containing protein [Pirellulales bacterium]|nr:sulfotransferase domain-containing protein [Pirellulales bacterium]